MANKYDYDAIIIGAGIGGLVCGCYLAKAGLKTLIVEKNNHVGGYCSSFEKNGFLFDYCTHAISSLREGGILKKILVELGIQDKLKIVRHNPTDIIITDNFEIKLYREAEKIISEFSKVFPKEEVNTKKFFKYIDATPSFYLERKKTFYQLLPEYFKDKKLISIISFVTESLLGTGVKEMSAMVACLMWKEFILDGGYYPASGGMQSIANLFAGCFKNFGGSLLLSTKANGIMVANNTAKSVKLQDGRVISARNIVSACDARQTYFQLIGKENAPGSVIEKINALTPSSSFNIVYLGITNYPKESSKLESNLYMFDEKSFVSSSMKKCNMPGTAFGVNIFKAATGNKSRSEIIKGAKEILDKILPGASKYITFEAYATPKTLQGWTNNYNGAAFGWASTPEQFCNPDISQKTKIDGLYITGHWSNQSSGISFVANCARDSAKIIE